ncbi:MAG: hypothetical protein OZSIB_0603 [Candidatus Ozemobacter sibiricus]|uniref:Uncharacterized protein n=1 Tax=Candidatus Ozemobacter sibiricus TaxID=2268124 RepID=A0A367ZUS5_9BACT|nr:MAG: hypothetical protein OZSIB_0603 [Candidatus Ozemobacter sibiricus]
MESQPPHRHELRLRHDSVTSWLSVYQTVGKPYPVCPGEGAGGGL